MFFLDIGSSIFGRGRGLLRRRGVVIFLDLDETQTSVVRDGEAGPEQRRQVGPGVQVEGSVELERLQLLRIRLDVDDAGDGRDGVRQADAERPDVRRIELSGEDVDDRKTAERVAGQDDDDDGKRQPPKAVQDAVWVISL